MLGPPDHRRPGSVPEDSPTSGPLEWAPPRGGRLAATAFVLQEDGVLRCPQGVLLWHSETRQETRHTQRLIYVAYDADCAASPQRIACAGRTASGKRGRRVSAVRHQQITTSHLFSIPPAAPAAIRWKDVAGRQLRRPWMAHWHQQAVTMTALPLVVAPIPRSDRAARSHHRLSWLARHARNARAALPIAPIQVSGVASHLLDLLA